MAKNKKQQWRQSLKPTGPLTQGQSANLADKANAGGFSVNIQGGRVSPVKGAYMVGGQAPTGTYDSPVTASQVGGYAATRPELQQPGYAYGAWHDEARQPKPQVDLDVSRAYPLTSQGKAEARAETVSRDEMSYGEIDTEGDYVDTHNNPFSARMMGRNAENAASYTTRQAAIARGQHFRSGINSEALFHLMSGNPEAARQTWIHA